MSVESWSAVHTPYNETEVNKYAPTSAGVYALWVNYKSGRWASFYVGKADNIETRLLDHLRDDEPNECIKKKVKYRCAFCWVGITTASERSGVEKYLYDKMKPKCNQIDPGGTPLPIPLPPEPAPTTPST